MATPAVLIIGAGAAGLSAAHELSQAGVGVRVIEARQRLGGRIHTTESSPAVPVELGAEFTSTTGRTIRFRAGPTPMFPSAC